MVMIRPRKGAKVPDSLSGGHVYLARALATVTGALALTVVAVAAGCVPYVR